MNQRTIDQRTISATKVASWQAGMMILDLFQTTRFYRFNKDYIENELWGNDDDRNKDNHNAILKCLDPDDSHYNMDFELFIPVIKKMLAFDPNERSTIEEACSQFEQLLPRYKEQLDKAHAPGDGKS
ncbi:hypothetical protein [Endozoicomonas sp.]|uniref:hypothetical protein n=1 Tax=Endozoicomonas sp. TaxID=1892382 RepID=UPI00383BC9CA